MPRRSNVGSADTVGRKSSRPVQPAATQFSTLRKRQAAQDYNRRTAVSRMRATLRLCGVAQQAPSRAQIAQISALRKQDALHAQCSVGSLRKFADCVTAYAERVPIEARVEKVGPCAATAVRSACGITRHTATDTTYPECPGRQKLISRAAPSSFRQSS